MRTHFRDPGGALACIIGLAIALATSSPVLAGPNDVVAVEEHWALQVSRPDAQRSTPQITMLMSPTGTVQSVYFQFTLNHANVATYAPGGLQVQSWLAGIAVHQRATDINVALDRPNEVIRWTQRLSLLNGNLRFQVCDGESETWGTFGGDDLTLDVATLQANLNSYRPSLSLNGARVGFAENCPVSLILTKVAWLTEDGQVHEQSGPISVEANLGN